MYRIVCVSDEEIPKVIWKGPLGRKYEVAILYVQGHFDAIKSISRFYKLDNFCMDCEEAYHEAKTHYSKCKVELNKIFKSLTIHSRPNASIVAAFNMVHVWLNSTLMLNVKNAVVDSRIPNASNTI
jgi:hypothetical protein